MERCARGMLRPPALPVSQSLTTNYYLARGRVFLPRSLLMWKILLLSLVPFLLHAKKPNVLVFLTDDQGWGDLSCSGNGDLQTPHVDSLARDGVSFERFYVCAVCSPTRAEFFTGRHHARCGVYSTSRGGERINLDEITLADLLKAAGYRTGAFGKWHSGMQYPYHPNGRGFDEFYGFCSGHWGHYFSPMLERNGRIVKGEGFCIDDFTNQAMKFMEDCVEKERPFFTYIPYNTPHSPMQVPDEFWEKFAKKPLKLKNEQQPEKENDSHKRCALAMCENLDWNVGRVLEKLRELKVEEETIVIWFHDNGPNGVRWNGGMRGKKGSTDEGGVRSPLFIRWPGTIVGGKKVEQITTVRDLLPTICELVKVDVPQKRKLDGLSLTPLIFDKKAEWPERILINQWVNRVSVRSQRYRLDRQEKLYDMIADPGQKVDVSKKYPKVTEMMRKRAQDFRKEHLKDYAKDDRPFVIAHPDFPLSQLPARDAREVGGLKRSSRHPNDSYYLNWTSKNAKVVWDVEVGMTGEYEVVLYYAAQEAGAECELAFGDSILKFKIEDAHDVPEIGKKEDRSPRTESYVKDFKPLKIGTMKLEKGKGRLVLRATDFPGKEAMEFRLLTLERK